MRYTDEMYERQKGRACSGRIYWYNRMRGYGIIRTEGMDIFLSSFNFKEKHGEKKAVMGALVSFVPEPYGEGYSATEVDVLEKYPAGSRITLPDGRKLGLKNMKTAGLRRGEDGLFVFFSTPDGEVRVTAEDLGGQDRDVAGYWKELEQALFTVPADGKEASVCRQQ